MNKHKLYTTMVITGEKYYGIPDEIKPTIKVCVYNRKKKQWSIRNHDVCLKIQKILKTDEQIKIETQ